MSKNTERMKRSLSATVRMKTGTDVFASSIVECYARNITLIIYSYLEQQRMWVFRNNCRQIAKKSNFKHYLDTDLKLVISKFCFFFSKRQNTYIRNKKGKSSPYWLTLLKRKESMSKIVCKCPSFNWDRVSFLLSSWYNSVFLI